MVFVVVALCVHHIVDGGWPVMTGKIESSPLRWQIPFTYKGEKRKKSQILIDFPSQPPRITYGCRGALLGQLRFHDSIVPVYRSYGQIGYNVM